MTKIFFFLLAFFSVIELSLVAQADETEVNPNRTVELNKDSDFLIDHPDYDQENPHYRRLPSRMAFGFRCAIYGIPYHDALGSTYQLFGEYVLPWQTLGSFSLGMHVGSFPLYAPQAGIPNRQFENAIAGAIFRYQFRYAYQQLIVPTGALEWEYYRIQKSAAGSISGSDFGLSAGLMLNLGFIDRETEFNAYESIGLVRSYFTSEVRTANLKNDVFVLNGLYWLWGIRLEFE